MEERWAIYIDIQGFSALWEKEDQILMSLGELLLAIVRIGRHCYPNSPDRIFAHQFGDGCLVISEFAECDLERCVTIAIAILRHVASNGRFAKAAIVEGQMMGIQSCYPEEIFDDAQHDSRVSLGDGLMTIVPVMGTALIRGVRLEKESPSGPLLTICSRDVERLPAGLKITQILGDGIASIDWVHYESDLLDRLQLEGNLEAPTQPQIEKTLQEYCKKEPTLSDKWVSNVGKYLNVPQAT